MARLRLDFRKVLRAVANRTQDENQARLLASQGVNGEGIAPRAVEPVVGKSRRRIRLGPEGTRVAVKDLQRVGIRSGAMLADLTRRGNARIGRVSFKIVPSPAVRAKYWAFVKGRRGGDQPARPTGGMTDALLADAATQVATVGRDQVVASLQKRGRS